jgi:hypothetical protein
MPDIPLLNPVVLRGVVEKLQAPESLILLNKVPQTPWPFPAVTWDVVTGSRNVASPNVPNSEAHIVNPLGVAQKSAAFIYLREKKVFQPTTLHWLRSPGSLDTKRAEEAVMREIKDLNTRFDNFAEYLLWKSLAGGFTIANNDVTATVDYGFSNTHKPTVSTSWATATPNQMVSDIRTWKRLIQRDGRVDARTAFSTEATAARIFTAFTSTGASNAPAAALLSDRMRDQYYANGVIPGFMGLDWQITESVYEDAAGTATLFLPDDFVVLGNLDDNRPIEMMVGPTADDEAPAGYTGKFSKTWKEKDPSARQFLLEWHIMPVITRPEQFVYADVIP